MKTRSVALASAVSSLALTVAGLAPASTTPHAPPEKATSYLVRTTSAPTLDSPVVKTARRSGDSVQHVYSRVFTGFSAELTPDQMKTLRTDPKVKAVIRDGVVHASADQQNPTWGLDRIDQRGTKGSKFYRYGTSGAGVTAFVVDTGVRLTHKQFGASPPVASTSSTTTTTPRTATATGPTWRAQSVASPTSLPRAARSCPYESWTARARAI